MSKAKDAFSRLLATPPADGERPTRAIARLPRVAIHPLRIFLMARELSQDEGARLLGMSVRKLKGIINEWKPASRDDFWGLGLRDDAELAPPEKPEHVQTPCPLCGSAEGYRFAPEEQEADLPVRRGRRRRRPTP